MFFSFSRGGICSLKGMLNRRVDDAPTVDCSHAQKKTKNAMPSSSLIVTRWMCYFYNYCSHVFLTHASQTKDDPICQSTVIYLIIHTPLFFQAQVISQLFNLVSCFESWGFCLLQVVHLRGWIFPMFHQVRLRKSILMLVNTWIWVLK